MGVFDSQQNQKSVTAKVLRDFYFLPDDAPKGAKPKKVFAGSELELPRHRFAELANVNRVCLPGEYNERRKGYEKAAPTLNNGKKG